MIIIFESGKDGAEVIRVSFNDWEAVGLCAALGIICISSAIPVGVWEVRTQDPGLWPPPCCPECIAQSEEWLVMSQKWREFSDGEKRDGVYSCLFPVSKWKNRHFSSSQDLSYGVIPRYFDPPQPNKKCYNQCTVMIFSCRHYFTGLESGNQFFVPSKLW